MKRIFRIIILWLPLVLFTNVVLGFSLEKTELESDPSINTYKYLAKFYSETNDNSKAANYLDLYIKNSGDLTILKEDLFQSKKHLESYASVYNQYEASFSPLSLIYLYIALLGFFIAIVINFTRNSDKTSKLLISSFIAIHAFFILDFVFYNTNYQIKYAHTYLMSSSIALLYGPLLYFYFKRITQKYKFRKFDLLHLLPSLALIAFLAPVYALPLVEKIKIQFGTSELYSPQDFLYIVFIPKLVSLVVYALLIGRVHLKKISLVKIKHDPAIEFWKKGVYNMHVLYVASYVIYGISISGVLFGVNSFLYHSQVITMSAMVLYVSCMAYIQLKVFSLDLNVLNPLKYKKSGLTEDLSLELKQVLIRLLIDDQVYKDNSINLDKLSHKLDTTRHNASQIINEQFDMNFFELINKFRIDEAINLLKTEELHIMDVAFEVGYNNKVTFNKAFKKETALTPTQYIQNLKKVK